MSTKEIITLAASIVNGEQTKAPALKGWELEELLWWIQNLKSDLV